MFVLALNFSAFNSKVVTTSCVPLSFLCITISLAASSEAQQAVELSLTGRVVQIGGSSSNGSSKD
jgi:hypothetical protein